MVVTTKYGFSKVVGLSFVDAVDRVTRLLAEQGFGVLCTLDVQAKLKEKMGKDMEEYVILGACNPPLAARALDAEPEIGLMLPCNVIVYRRDGKTHVAAIRPHAAMGMLENAALAEVAEQVETLLLNVISEV